MNRVDPERTRILCAARELIEYTGWQALDLDSLLRRAGVRGRSFHRHFAGVDGLLVALLEDELRSVSRRLRHAAASSMSPLQRIHSYTATMIACVYPAERSSRASLFAVMWLGLSERYFQQIDRLVDELIDPLREAIRDGCRTGTMSSRNPDTDAQAIFHLVIGVIVTQAALGRRASRGCVDEAIRDSVTRALAITDK